MKGSRAILIGIVFALIIVSFNTLIGCSATPLAEAPEEEIASFLSENNIEIPGGESNLDEWIDFIRGTIAQVEEDPNCFFVFNYTVAQELADAIKTAIEDNGGVRSLRRGA